MKKCNHCGTENPEGARFCRGCGQPMTDAAAQPAAAPAAPAPAPAPAPVPAPAVPAPAPAAPQYAAPAPGAPQQPHSTYQQPAPAAPVPGQPAPAPAAPSAQSEASKAFFEWLLESFKTPSRKFANVQAWWPIIPLVFNGLLMALTVYMWQSKALSAATSVGNGILGELGSLTGTSAPQVSAGVPIGELFKGWITYSALIYIVVLISLLGRKLMGDPISFVALHTELAQKFMPMVALYLVAFLFALIGSGMIVLSVLLFMMGILYILAAPGAIIAQGTATRKLDKTWLWIFGVLIGGLILLIFFLILGVSGAASAVSSFKSMF